MMMPSEPWLFLLLPAACFMDMVLPFVLGGFCPGYRHKTMAMSSLGSKNSPVRRVYNLWLVLAGLMFLGGGYWIFQVYSDVSRSLAAACFICIAVYAVGACILAGIFSVDENPETAAKKRMSLPSLIHGVSAAVGFMSLLVSSCLFGVLLVLDGSVLFAAGCFVFFGAAALFFVLFVMSDKEQFAGTVIDSAGLWQRLTLLCMYVSLLIAAAAQILF